MYEYYSLNNHQPSSHLEHDNPIPMCLMSALFVVTTHSLEAFVIIETRAQEVRGRACYLACSMGTLGNWIMTLGLLVLVRAQCHCDLCYVKWFDLSYDYLSNFRGLISLGWKHLILLVPRNLTIQT